MAFNRKQKLRDNIEAIRTAFILDRENRTATSEERAILQRYCGFGGLKCILNPAKELTDAVRWAKSDLELFVPTVELHRLIRENSKDETEYKRFVDSLKASVLTAFYTPKEITDTIADVLADYSVRPARMLEPSAGVGVFVDSMLRHSPNADVMAFEKDLLTGTILRHLYPDQKMRTCGFEKIERPCWIILEIILHTGTGTRYPCFFCIGNCFGILYTAKAGAHFVFNLNQKNTRTGFRPESSGQAR